MVRQRGLTLTEILIVTIVLALLAAVVTPQFSRAANDANLNTLRANLLDVRAQLRLYRTQHGEGYPRLDQFVAQMTQHTSAEGRTSTERTFDCGLGPYLHAIPNNPYTGGNIVSNGKIGSSDWFYDENTGLFRANHDPAFARY